MIVLEQREFENLIHKVIAAMENAGYDPVAQFTGYLQTGDETFITRSGEARTIVRSLDKEQIAEYLNEHYPHFKRGTL